MDWSNFKELAAHVTLEKDALHVYAAFGIQVTVAAVLRRPLGDWFPWLGVLGVELLNELIDIIFGEESQVQQWQVIGASHDILNTMILPTALLVLCRRAPKLFREHRLSKKASTI